MSNAPDERLDQYYGIFPVANKGKGGGGGYPGKILSLIRGGIEKMANK